ncbi:AMP-binding protein [Tateyamaria sp.]|uniref:AMP-binding protein n=1 Tax=Tateyamaria sp. TaxID=1929288 RepID=UPI0032A02A4C
MTDQPPRLDNPLGIVACNSPDYVRRMLQALEAGRVTVPLRHAQDHDRIDRTGVREIVTPAADHGWLSQSFASPASNQLAMLSFTSGTEGPPKAVHLSQANLHDVVQRLVEVMAMTGDIREYVGVPVYHSFGYGRCRAVLSVGGACFIPETGFDLSEIRKMLKAGEINAISTVPSLWRLFLQQSDMFGPELEAVRWVEIGSQFMSVAEKLALRQLLPNARIVQHYGLTEASRSTFLRIDGAPEAILDSVGPVDGPVGARIDNAGRIQVQGTHVALALENADHYHSLAPGDWLTTSDKGRIAQGYLYFEGRADDVINCAGIKLSPDLMEAAMRAAVPQSGAFGITRCDDALRGDGILLALTPKAEPYKENLIKALEHYMEGQGLSARSSIVVQTHDSLPRTDTGKLQRAALKVIPVDSNNTHTDFAHYIRSVVGAEALHAGQSFFDSGSDSLSHMQIQLTLERALGTAPPDWEAAPLSQLVAQVEAIGTIDTLPEGSGGAPPLPDGSRNCNPADLSFWALVGEDYRTNDANIFHQGFLMLFIHRFGNWRMSVRPRILRMPLTMLYRFFNKLTQLLFGMKLDYTVKVGRRVKLEHFGGMILGAREIGNDVVLRQNTTMGIRTTMDTKAKPTIGAFVDIGAGAVIAGNITIGENAIIGANTVVYTNVPPNAVVVGVPGRIIGQNPRRNPSPLALRPEA